MLRYCSELYNTGLDAELGWWRVGSPATALLRLEHGGADLELRDGPTAENR